MATAKLDLSCGCGASVHYEGAHVAFTRDAFLKAHTPCMGKRSTPRPTEVVVQLDGRAVNASLLKLRRHQGRRGI